MRRPKYVEYQKHEKVYVELAEKRAIELLGLSEKEVLIAKAYETTKVFELNKLKKEIQKVNREKLTWYDVLFGRLN